MKISNSTIDAFADMWRQSRKDSGKSQEYVAKQLSISRRTVESWESGEGCPNQRQGFEWFKVLDRPPLPYYYRILYPVHFDSSIDHSDMDVQQALFDIISDLSPEEQRKLLYCLSGHHGRSTRSFLELAVMYLQLPLSNVISIASHIVINYRLCSSLGTVLKHKKISPNIELIDHAIKQATQSVVEGKENYTNIIF